jgi:hypothetical protein
MPGQDVRECSEGLLTHSVGTPTPLLGNGRYSPEYRWFWFELARQKLQGQRSNIGDASPLKLAFLMKITLMLKADMTFSHLANKKPTYTHCCLNHPSTHCVYGP